MRLEIDKTHKTAKFNKLKGIGKRFSTTVLGVVLTVTLFSGCRNNDVPFEIGFTDESYSSSVALETDATEVSEVVENTEDEKISSYLRHLYGRHYVLDEIPENVELEEIIGDDFVQINEYVFALKGDISPYLTQVDNTVMFELNDSAPADINLEEIKGDNLIQIDEKTFKLKGVYIEDDKSAPSEYENAVHKIVDGDTIVEVPGFVAHTISRFKGVEYTKDMELCVSDFNYIEYYNADYSEDLSWVKYCNNLESLSLRRYMDYEGNYLSDKFSSLDVLVNAPNIKELSLSNGYSGNVSFTNEKFEFIKDMQSLERLELSGFELVQPGLVESFSNIDELKVYAPIYSNIDYSKMTFLKSLELACPETVVKYMNIIQYNELVENGVDIKIYKDWQFDEDALNEYLAIAKLDLYSNLADATRYINNEEERETRGR